MRRLIVFPLLAAAVAATVVACGSDGDSAFETLPTIRTTTSTTTTTTTPDMRRIFYEVKPGDNLSEIARAYQVPRQAIVDLNGLENGGETIQVGQILEIPNDVRLDATLPSLPDETSDA